MIVFQKLASVCSAQTRCTTPTVQKYEKTANASVTGKKKTRQIKKIDYLTLARVMLEMLFVASSLDEQLSNDEPASIFIAFGEKRQEIPSFAFSKIIRCYLQKRGLPLISTASQVTCFIDVSARYRNRNFSYVKILNHVFLPERNLHKWVQTRISGLSTLSTPLFFSSSSPSPPSPFSNNSSNLSLYYSSESFVTE